MGRKDIGIRNQALWIRLNSLDKKVNKFDNIKKILKSIKEKINLWIFIKKVSPLFSKGITLNQVLCINE